ncbi:ABC-type Fe3+-siderophores transport system, periplasmic component [Corynebacterium suranareeae]|uniref:ABC-type Fe3+-siderophores transport system, periplasmic component n=1 Tax=Corynebacterium suranareeae TaxID=2506452 RepID=A0A160PNR7_9CORY|nr:iron-siderophore ABC transporter substrate-binding protein [Corynebacterium suranareeae]BAU95044.1 ABC-type Fe3+-siderophores transport system, periplasmic component [Corynebacterium suranareeae]
MHSRLSRFLRPSIIGVAVVALLAGCTSTADEADTNSTSAENAAFPVSIEHEFGTTTIESAPERVVTLGVTDADIVLALGTVPVGNTGYTFFENGLGPWTDDLVGDQELTLIDSDSTPDLEQVAALEPDLIIGVSAGFDDVVYEQLSDIAPVVARPSGTAAYAVDREEATNIVATAMGQAEKGRELNEETNALIEAAREENPSFAGKTGTVILPYQGKYGAYLPGDARGQFLESLGITLPEAILSRDTGDSFFVDVPAESVADVEGDLLLVLSNDENLDITAENPLFETLNVVQNDAVIVATIEERGAITYNSVLSVPFALDHLVPRFAEALSQKQLN